LSFYIFIAIHVFKRTLQTRESSESLHEFVLVTFDKKIYFDIVDTIKYSTYKRIFLMSLQFLYYNSVYTT